jgi:hypothetical protein
MSLPHSWCREAGSKWDARVISHHDDGFSRSPVALLPAFERFAPSSQRKGCGDLHLESTAADQSGEFRELTSIASDHEKRCRDFVLVSFADRRGARIK